MRIGAARAVPAMPGMVCCECKFEGASRWHWAMHDWVEQRRCVYRFACRNLECLALHTIAEQEHKRTKQKLGQREWEAECGFCSVGTCRYGAVCQRAVRVSVAYDSSYEDEEDGWSVAGVGRGNSFGTELVGRTDRASLGAPGRFGPFVEKIEDEEEDEEEDDVLGDEFFDCPCDDPKFRFVIREERRTKQQQRRKREGQQRKGRTARKRVAAASASVGVQGNRIRKRLCWLRAKLRRTVSLWHAVIAEARTCYGARKPDITEWRELEVQMMRQLSQDERFWEGAVDDVTNDGVMICSGENERLQGSIAQMQRFKRVALDGKSGRFEAEKHLAEWHASATERARDMQVYGEERRARQARKKLVRRQGACADPSCDSSSEECCGLLQSVDGAAEEYARGRNMRAAATAAAATRCTAQMWARKEKRKVMKQAAESSVMGVQLVTDPEDWRVGYDERMSKYFCDTESDDIDDVCYSNATRDFCFSRDR